MWQFDVKNIRRCENTNQYVLYLRKMSYKHKQNVLHAAGLEEKREDGRLCSEQINMLFIVITLGCTHTSIQVEKFKSFKAWVVKCRVYTFQFDPLHQLFLCSLPLFDVPEMQHNIRPQVVLLSNTYIYLCKAG